MGGSSISPSSARGTLLALAACVSLLVPAGTAFAAADVWSPVVTNGFGDSSSRSVYWLQSFKGALYAGIEKFGLTSLHRSTDGTTFAPVTFNPAFGPSNQGIAVFGMVDDETRLYAGIAGPPGSSTSPFYRSTDGVSFEQINGAGSGYVTTGNSAILPSPQIFGGRVYFATRNPNGTQIWRQPLDGSAPWEKVFDAASLAVTADRPLQKMTTWMWVFGGRLYAATTGASGTGEAQSQAQMGPAHLWRSDSGDAGSWTDVLASNPGFGNPENNVIASMAELNGVLYAGTTNRPDAAELWRSSDGEAWQILVGPGGVQPSGFGNPSISELHHLEAIDGRLWITTAAPELETPSPPTAPPPPEVWRTADGTSFVRSNDPGFGGQAIGGFPNLEGFAGKVYASARCSGGACIFRTDIDPPDASLTKKPKKVIETDEDKVKVTFKFSADEADASFLCKLDRGAEKRCASPFRKQVGIGKHKFAVVAVDPAGNRDPTPANAKFKVEEE